AFAPLHRFQLYRPARRLRRLRRPRIRPGPRQHGPMARAQGTTERSRRLADRWQDRHTRTERLGQRHTVLAATPGLLRHSPVRSAGSWRGAPDRPTRPGFAGSGQSGSLRITLAGSLAGRTTGLEAARIPPDLVGSRPAGTGQQKPPDPRCRQSPVQPGAGRLADRILELRRAKRLLVARAHQTARQQPGRHAGDQAMAAAQAGAM
ncbi:Outer membrane lipoprotein component of lipoprotein transport system LolB, partial [Pseudomonas sp. FG-3G]